MAVQAVARRSDGKNMPPDLPPIESGAATLQS